MCDHSHCSIQVLYPEFIAFISGVAQWVALNLESPCLSWWCMPGSLESVGNDIRGKWKLREWRGHLGRAVRSVGTHGHGDRLSHIWELSRTLSDLRAFV